MNSENDLLHHTDTLQQAPLRSFKPRIWKVIFILLFFVDAIIGYYLLFEIRVYDYDSLTKIAFILLTIVNLLLAIGYEMLTAHSDSLELLKVSFVLLILGNLILGYNIYDHSRYSIGIAFIPLIYVFGVNDLTTVLFYIRTQHPQGITKIICRVILILTSLYLALPAGIFIYMWLFRF